MSGSNELDEAPFDHKKHSISSDDRSVRTASIMGDDAMDIDANVQYAGILKKPPFGTKSYGKLTRWTERFCVVKESFLLYYEKAERRAYESKRMFNIHPKGVIPLAGCTIEKFDDTGKPAFKITHASFKTEQRKMRASSLSLLRRDSASRRDCSGNLVMAARNPEERDNWVAILRECSKVTWNNAQLGAAQIKILEENTARINAEKTEYIEKLQAEAEARAHEGGKREELERLAKQLEEEKAKIENVANQFKEEKEMTNQELLDAMEAMKRLDEERRAIDNKSKEMEEDLKRMEEEKKMDIEQLKKKEKEAEHLAEASNKLKSHLESVEETAKRLADEKLQTEQRLEENKKKTIVFEEEKKKLLRTATQAQLHLEEVSAKKQETEKQLDLTATTLEIEKNERKKLEKRLRLAEDSLKRLDSALRDSGLKVSLEIEADVTTLKSFFEDAAAEAELQAKKHLLMEEAVRAKKNYEKKAYISKRNADMFSARDNMNRVDVDPRLMGESQSTRSPEHGEDEAYCNGETPVPGSPPPPGDEPVPDSPPPPSQGDAPRVDSPEQILSDGEIIPEIVNADDTQNEATPARNDAAPAVNETTPAESETTPAENETTQAEDETVPAENEATPEENETTPAENETTPAESEIAPAVNETVPAENDTVQESKTDNLVIVEEERPVELEQGS